MTGSWKNASGAWKLLEKSWNFFVTKRVGSPSHIFCCCNYMKLCSILTWANTFNNSFLLFSSLLINAAICIIDLSVADIKHCEQLQKVN